MNRHTPIPCEVCAETPSFDSTRDPTTKELVWRLICGCGPRTQFRQSIHSAVADWESVGYHRPAPDGAPATQAAPDANNEGLPV